MDQLNIGDRVYSHDDGKEGVIIALRGEGYDVLFDDTTEEWLDKDDISLL